MLEATGKNKVERQSIRVWCLGQEQGCDAATGEIAGGINIPN